MKTIWKIFTLSSIFLLSACQKDQIVNEVTVLGKVLEINANFTNANDYKVLYEFPQNMTVYESDVVLVYLLEDVVNGVDVWTLLPQTFFTPNGTLLYTYNHTYYDVSVFLTANFDLSLASSGFTQNKVFRIAVVPAEFALKDSTNLNSVMGDLQLENKDIITLTNSN